MKPAFPRWIWIGAAAFAVTARSWAGQGEPVDFTHDVLPMLSRFGCNASACHGKAEGQNGFKLSVFGNDPKADHDAIVKQSRGRRIMAGAPDESLLLRKAAAQLPHAGGPRMKSGSPEYAVLRNWIAAGSPYTLPEKSEVTAVRTETAERVMGFEQKQA